MKKTEIKNVSYSRENTIRTRFKRQNAPHTFACAPCARKIPSAKTKKKGSPRSREDPKEEAKKKKSFTRTVSFHLKVDVLGTQMASSRQHHLDVLFFL